MNKVLNKVLPVKQEGATAIEYGLIAGLIAAVLVAAMLLLNGGLTNVFTDISTELNSAAGN